MEYRDYFYGYLCTMVVIQCILHATEGFRLYKQVKLFGAFIMLTLSCDVILQFLLNTDVILKEVMRLERLLFQNGNQINDFLGG